MFIGKVMKYSHYLLIIFTLGILLQSCGNPSLVDGNGENSIPNDNIPSLSPRLEFEVDGTIRITPIQIEAYLVNPGIGWQDGPEPFGIMNFPETVAYSNRRRISWASLNPAKGVYDWSPLNTQLNGAVQSGKQFSFRIYTFVGEGYDGHMIPAWVLDEGARLLPSGEPDYSNCVYQEAWGEFVTELIRVYDGNPHIAFIDISGYGNFGEWSWRDEQTEWDERWTEDFAAGTPSGASFQTLDGQARRRLADIFIGGSFNGHACRMPNGEIIHVKYVYQGFQKTQLLMPYAGIIQSSQYVYSRRSNIGFRYDCLGKDGQKLFDKTGLQILQIWKNAPVVYELCKPNEMDPEDAKWLLQMTHGSIVHNNNWSYSLDQLEDMMIDVGYRYFLKVAQLTILGRRVDIQMEWQNIGTAPNYPSMGQDFKLYFYLVDDSGVIVLQDFVPADIPGWLPAGSIEGEQPSYFVSDSIQLPSSFINGQYLVGVSIIDMRIRKPILLAFGERDANGVYVLASIKIE